MALRETDTRKPIGMSPNIAGALLMMGSMLCFTLNDTLVKLTAGAVPLAQLVFLRGAMTTGLIFAARGHLGPLHFRGSRRDWKFIVIRVAAELWITFCFLSALLHMPLGNLTAILQSVPLTVTLVAALFLKEPVGWPRGVAIAVGFFGVMLIVKPGTDGFSLWSVYALGAVAGVTLRDLATRQLSPDVSSITVTLITAVTIMVLAGGLSVFDTWVAITPVLALFIFGAAVSIMGGYFLSVHVMRVGEVSFVSPFRYFGLVCAMILGAIVFGERPDALTLTGAAIVAGTGIFTLYRERRKN